MKSRLFLPLIAVAGLAPHLLIAQDKPAAETPSHYTYTESNREGIGKFYLGREISHVVGHQAIQWLERDEREKEELPDEVVKNMELKPTEVVADIGAGSGYFTFRMAKKVPEGKVYAVDIQEPMLNFIRLRAEAKKLENVVAHLGEIEDTKLPAGKFDAVLMVDAYHEFSHPREMLESIVVGLKPGGRVILLEYRGEDPEVPIKRLHKMTEAQSKKEMAAVGLEWKETREFLPSQHFMVFVKPAS
ncbi:MAG: ubiquinone/menaquinone biosynthesis C-methylase UbiE [Verrucomicrobiales bacterium]|jgi:ubiquinone/menaquinone biosynthesis C-methylase UbiE